MNNAIRLHIKCIRGDRLTRVAGSKSLADLVKPRAGSHVNGMVNALWRTVRQEIIGAIDNGCAVLKLCDVMLNCVYSHFGLLSKICLDDRQLNVHI